MIYLLNLFMNQNLIIILIKKKIEFIEYILIHNNNAFLNDKINIDRQ